MVILLSLRNEQLSHIVDERRQLLNGLSTVDYTAKHHKIQIGRYEGTGDWISESEAYLAWEKSVLYRDTYVNPPPQPDRVEKNDVLK